MSGGRGPGRVDKKEGKGKVSYIRKKNRVLMKLSWVKKGFTEEKDFPEVFWRIKVFFGKKSMLFRNIAYFLLLIINLYL